MEVIPLVKGLSAFFFEDAAAPGRDDSKHGESQSFNAGKSLRLVDFSCDPNCRSECTYVRHGLISRDSMDSH